MRPLTSGWQRAALWAGGAVLGFVGIVGALHHPAARGLLRQVSGCPVGAPVSADARDAARAAALAGVRGRGQAPTMPSPVVALGLGTAADVRAWAGRVGVTCAGAVDLTCVDVPADAWGGPAPAAAIRFEVDGAARVVGTSVDLRGLGPERAAAAFSAMSEDVAARVGPPTEVRGQASGDWLAAAPLRQVAHRHRFADYRADVTATHAAHGEVVVRGVYQALTR